MPTETVDSDVSVSESKPKRGRGRPKKITPTVIAFVVKLRALRWSKGQIKDVLRSKFDLRPRSCERVITAAIEEQLLATGQSREDLRWQAQHFYEAIIRDTNSSDMAKIRAQEGIVKLYGLESPQRLEVTGATGKPVEVKHTIDYDEFGKLFEQTIAGTSKKPARTDDTQ